MTSKNTITRMKSAFIVNYPPLFWYDLPEVDNDKIQNLLWGDFYFKETTYTRRTVEGSTRLSEWKTKRSSNMPRFKTYGQIHQTNTPAVLRTISCAGQRAGTTYTTKCGTRRQERRTKAPDNVPISLLGWMLHPTILRAPNRRTRYSYYITNRPQQLALQVFFNYLAGIILLSLWHSTVAKPHVLS